MSLDFAPDARVSPPTASLAGLLCENGCFRPSFAAYSTCCRHCRGPDGPHAHDCAQKANLVGSRRLGRRGATADGGSTVVVRILRAKLNRTFDFYGKMDPFATATWKRRDGTEVSIGRTRSAWGEHMMPNWNHTCRAITYGGTGGGEALVLKVLEENFGGLGTPTFCGEASAKVDLLMSSARMVSAGLMSTNPEPLVLTKKSEETGAILIQLLWYLPDAATAGASFTPVDVAEFATPVQRIRVSGGTAPFFSLELKNPGPSESKSRWIGKDLSRAMDEVDFYEQCLRIVKSKGAPSGLEPLIQFMFEYKGVLEANEKDSKSQETLQLLVLGNLRDCCNRLRLLDIKIGTSTAAANWKGKSKLAALRQNILDGYTNSNAEGFRVEGFDGEPAVLQSMDPLLDVSALSGFRPSVKQKAHRIMLQRLSGADMFMHFLDLHIPATKNESRTLLLPSEVAEIVHHEICRKLVRLAIACREVTAPQKWIGSSVALSFDDERTLDAAGGLFLEEEIKDFRKSISVKIFDWGRSELNSIEHHSTLTAEEQADRLQFWRLYTDGIDRLAWEALRAYWHRFGNALGWNHVQLTVFDFDSMTENDFIGLATIKLRETAETTVSLTRADGQAVHGKAGASTITYAIAWRQLGRQSRLQGVWRLTVISANRLPVCDPYTSGSSDPFVAVSAISEDKTLCFKQLSTTIPKTLDPSWHETFELPVALPQHTSLEAISGNRRAGDFETSSSSVLLPPALVTADGAKAEGEGFRLCQRFFNHLTGRRSRTSFVVQ